MFTQSMALDIQQQSPVVMNLPVKLCNLRWPSIGYGAWKMWDFTPLDFFNIKSKSLWDTLIFTFLWNMK